MNCYCGLEKSFKECCQPYLEGQIAPTAEKLMRSRFAAFCTRNLQYIKDTTDPQLMNEIDWQANEEWMNSVDFYKLEILRSEENVNKAVIEFKAYFRVHGKESVHHEISKFRKQKDQWYFRDGKGIQEKPEKA